MPILRFTIDGKSDDLDTDNLLLSEAEVLEEHAGLDVEALADAGSLKKVRTMGHFLWLLKLREIAAEHKVPLHKAALMCPRDDFDIALGALTVEAVNPLEPAPTRTPRTRTPPGGSSRPRPRTAKNATKKSAASPTSSTSAPGSSPS